jgi:hypothetical protein
MTDKTIEALVAALKAAEGLPVPSPEQYAHRIENALTARGYEIVPSRGGGSPPSVARGYRCTCKSSAGCLAHPFGAVREINP